MHPKSHWIVVSKEPFDGTTMRMDQLSNCHICQMDDNRRRGQLIANVGILQNLNHAGGSFIHPPFLGCFPQSIRLRFEYPAKHCPQKPDWRRTAMENINGVRNTKQCL